MLFKFTDFFELVQAKLLMIRLHLECKQGQRHRSIESAHTPLLSLDPYAANGYGMVKFSLLKVWTSSSEVLPRPKSEGRVTLFYCCFLSVTFNHTPYVEMNIRSCNVE